MEGNTLKRRELAQSCNFLYLQKLKIPLVFSQGSFYISQNKEFPHIEWVPLVDEIKSRCPILQVPSNPLHPTPVGLSHTLFHQLSGESVRDGGSFLLENR